MWIAIMCMNSVEVKTPFLLNMNHEGRQRVLRRYV
jgi:hypothetical protein